MGNNLHSLPLLQPFLKDCKTFAYVRFVHDNCNFGGVDGGLSTSCGSVGRFLYKDLSSKYKEDRRRLLAKRSLALLNAEEEKDEESTSDNESASDDSDDSDSDESASGIEPDSEDEALLQENESDSDSQGDAGDAPTSSGGALSSGGDGKDNKTQSEKELSDLIDAQVSKQESTRHLAYGLLGLDIGYSSDEGGDEDVAFYVSDIALLYFRACPTQFSFSSHRLQLTLIFLSLIYYRLMELMVHSHEPMKCHRNLHPKSPARIKQWMKWILMGRRGLRSFP